MSEKLDELSFIMKKDLKITDNDIEGYNRTEHEPIDKSLNEKLATSFKLYF